MWPLHHEAHDPHPAAITTTSLGGNVVFLPSGGFVAATTGGSSRSSDHDIQVGQPGGWAWR